MPEPNFDRRLVYGTLTDAQRNDIASWFDNLEQQHRPSAIVVVPASKMAEVQRGMGTKRATSPYGFSNGPARRIYLSSNVLTGDDPNLLKFTLFHELGHIVGKTDNEIDATKVGGKLYAKAFDAPFPTNEANVLHAEGAGFVKSKPTVDPNEAAATGAFNHLQNQVFASQGQVQPTSEPISAGNAIRNSQLPLNMTKSIAKNPSLPTSSALPTTLVPLDPMHPELAKTLQIMNQFSPK